MPHPFDALEEKALRSRPSLKWTRYPDGVLPMWVADMDFPAAEPIREAVGEFAAGGWLGYPPAGGLPGLREEVVARLAQRYNLYAEPTDVTVLPGIIPGIHLSCLAFAGPDEGVVIQPPVYPPFGMAIELTGRRTVLNPMCRRDGGWVLDPEGLEAAIDPGTRLLILCNPQNPTGRAFRRDELEAVAEVALRHRLWVVSDELHADLVIDGSHVPFASLGPEVAERTITLYGPTKAFNIAGLKIGFAIITNPWARERLEGLAKGLVPPGNVLAQVATLAAYRNGEGWLRDTLAYLRGNRDALVDFVAESLPGVEMDAPQATYLAWLDFRRATLHDPLDRFLVDRAGVALNSGEDYGAGGEGFARLNFATSRPLLMKALEALRVSLAELR